MLRDQGRPTGSVGVDRTISNIFWYFSRVTFTILVYAIFIRLFLSHCAIRAILRSNLCLELASPRKSLRPNPTQPSSHALHDSHTIATMLLSFSCSTMLETSLSWVEERQKVLVRGAARRCL